MFVRYESQHNTRQTVNQVFCALHIYSTQIIQSITYFCPRILNNVIFSIRSCESFVTIL